MTTPGEAGRSDLKAVPEDKLERLFQHYGVEREFIEFSGNVARIALESRLSILHALGVDLPDEAAVDALLASEDARLLEDWLEPVVLAAEHQAASFRLACPERREDETLRWRLDLEDGSAREAEFRARDCAQEDGREHGGQRYSLRRVGLPELPPGYHQLSLLDAAGALLRSALLIVSPPRCFQPGWMEEGRRLWGVSAQLYTLCSAENHGIGDFGDLRRLLTLVAARGAQFVLLNPFHALELNTENASPYSPVDRRFLNPLYIDVAAAADFRDSPEAAEWLARPEACRRLQELKAGDLVDYGGVSAFKYQLYARMYQRFQARAAAEPAREDFRAWVEAQGENLQAFADYQAAVELPDVECAREPRFHMYLQWLAQRQLEDCQALAVSEGMKVGLIRDLAVGGGSESCEVRSNPALFCLQARIGAPPDNFNPDGQNWGLPPMRPDVLRQSHFAHFIHLLRANMSACGALRIDHVMALMRLWWCPCDGSNAGGAYVRYPVDELFAILRLESQRARCVVVGEDLGVVPPEIRRYLDEGGVLSNVIFYFEKYDGWHFKKPEHYPHRALALVANHDVPPLKAWWDLHDLGLRRELGLVPDDAQLEKDSEFRRQEKGQVLDWLEQQRLLPDDWRGRDLDKPYDVSLGAAIFHACASCASLLVSVQVDDIACMDSPVNIPGIGPEYPNWRRRIPIPPDALFAAEDSERLLAGLRQERP